MLAQRRGPLPSRSAGALQGMREEEHALTCISDDSSPGGDCLGENGETSEEAPSRSLGEQWSLVQSPMEEVGRGGVEVSGEGEVMGLAAM